MISGEGLVFTLAGERYALPMDAVSEVLPRASLVRVPEAPRYVVGLLRLRGGLLPVLDLRQRLGLPPTDPRITHRIVVAWVGSMSVGLLVDAVQGLASLGKTAGSDHGRLVRAVVESPLGVVSVLNASSLVEAETAALLSALLGEGASEPGQQPTGAAS